MKTVQEYLRHAEECEVLASQAASQAQREAILDMAKTWRLLAAQREKLILGLSGPNTGSN